VIGNIGVGKTALLNLVCNTSHISRAGKNSITRTLQKESALFHNQTLELIDTPGMDSNLEKKEHIIHLYNALTC